MSGRMPGAQVARSSTAVRLRGLSEVERSRTASISVRESALRRSEIGAPQGWLRLRGVTRNNLDGLDVDIPLGVLTSVTGVSGSGKSSLVSQFLVEALAENSDIAFAGGCRRRRY